MNDPISDMLTRIRNSQAVFKPEVLVPFSQIKYEIAKILEKENFVEKVEKKGRGIKKNIKIVLKYQNKMPAILGLKRMSKPGQRFYLPAKKIRPIRGGFGTSIISTPEGLMTNKKARKKNLGGEIICEVW